MVNVSVPNDYFVFVMYYKKNCYKINKSNLNFTLNYNTKNLIESNSFTFTQYLILTIIYRK